MILSASAAPMPGSVISSLRPALLMSTSHSDAAGGTFFFLGGPATNASPVYTASNTFTGDLQYDLMSLTVAFSLSANSSVGLSGFVEQVEVPEPSAVLLLGLGLGALAWRRLA